MKCLCLPVAVLLIAAAPIFAQKKMLVALKVLPEPEHSNRYWFFRVEKPEGIKISKGQKFVIKGAYKTMDQDTMTKGSGIVSYIEDRYIQCEMSEKDAAIDPESGDLCFFAITRDSSRKDVFYKIGAYNINFISISGDTLFSISGSLSNWGESQTKSVVLKMKEDIRYTGKAMLKQNDSQQQLINDGDFKGQKLFNAMAEVKENDVMNFLKYVWAKPFKYSGSTWRISEVFATWMTSGTPKLNGEIKY